MRSFCEQGRSTVTDQDPIVTALLAERERAATDDHRRQIDHELRERGYNVPAKKADDKADDAGKARASAAGGDKTSAPEGRTSTRGKQTS
jgi:hypothetical protein